MKKIVFVIMAIALVVTPCLAQSARNASGVTYTQTRTNFTNIAVLGLDGDANPGYLALMGAAEGPGVNELNRPEYYLWVDETGDLCMASLGTLTLYNSFPTGKWRGNMGCTKVGNQS